MKVCFVAMPWQSLWSPSLPIGLLHSVLRQRRPDDRVTEYHGSLHWAQYLYAHSDGEINPSDYTYMAEESIFHGLGDWVFAGALWGNPAFGMRELRDYVKSTEVDLGAALAMREYVPGFLKMAADRVLADAPRVVGFTSTFMQNVSSLALAKELKRRAPEVTVIFGGANCDGVMGQALHRNFEVIDYVVRGEGEEALPALLECIEEGCEPAGIPGLCYRRENVSIATAGAHRMVPPANIPIPDFDAWHAEMESSKISEHVEPALIVEGARGCWWGEKHHCTFCGLNGATMTFRSKSPSQIQNEIKTLVERYQILDIIMVDNIVDMHYLTTVMPWVAETGWDVRLHYEVKSNLRPEQVSALAKAHVQHVQPGVESLNTHVLKLMNKGVTGAQNVRIIRECENYDLTCSWNYLYGFPGETEEDYLPIIDQLPALVHLQPPGETVRIAMERFSPNFNDPAIGFTGRWPARMYKHIYDLPEEELTNLVYLFGTVDLGITEATADRLRRATAAWKENYPNSRLVMVDDEEKILVVDLRQGWPRQSHHLAGWQAFAYHRMLDPVSRAALLRALHDNGHVVIADEVVAWLDELRQFGLIFDDGHSFVALATTGSPIKMAATSEPLASLVVSTTSRSPV